MLSPFLSALRQSSLAARFWAPLGRWRVRVVMAVCCLGLAGLSVRAEVSGASDMLVLGDAGSEKAHRLSAERSEVVVGGLGEAARQLLPLEPVSHNGGSIAFTLRVDPVRQNYVTVKLWGSDRGMERGRLMLYLDGRQVGYRHEGDHDVLNQSDEDPLYLGRFVYQTVALPVALTQGRAEVALRIAALGRMWPYGGTFEQKQKQLTEPSRGIYRVYSHVSPRLEFAPTEPQGAAPEDRVRPGGPGEELFAQMRATVNTRLAGLLAKSAAAPGDAKGSGERLVLLAEAYHTPWTVAYQKPETIAAFLRAAAEFVRPGLIGPQWTGAGPLGEGLARLGRDPLLESALDQEIVVPAELPFTPVARRAAPGAPERQVVPELGGATQRLTRREAWARFLRASVDWNRTQGRRSYTNQSMIVDFGIYAANRGLALIAPARALPEAEALRYLHESVGLEPWSGNDLPGGGSARPYGADYRLVSRKGLSRELGYVGSYGETILVFCQGMAELSGDARLREHLVRLVAARSYFRYPSLDADGWRTMKLASEIDNRVAHFPQPNGAYAVCDVREAWWMELPAFSRDPLTVGLTRQMLADNQYFPRLAGRLNDPDTLGMMRNIDAYETVKALPPVEYRLPFSPGQPDGVFADEENAVVALKHGDRRLFVNFYYRQERGVSGSTRILEVEPRAMRIATVLSGYEVDGTGGFWTRPDHVDFLRSGGRPPPGENLHQAWAGERLPIARRPADATQPAYGDWGPFVGKAAFYHLRYGDYLIAVNTTAERAYSLPVPAGCTRAKDLVTGREVDLARSVDVPPLSTRVLWLGGGDK